MVADVRPVLLNVSVTVPEPVTETLLNVAIPLRAVAVVGPPTLPLSVTVVLLLVVMVFRLVSATATRSLKVLPATTPGGVGVSTTNFEGVPGWMVTALVTAAVRVPLVAVRV